MDLLETIRELRAERDRIATTIANLEALNQSGDGTTSTVGARRGRKSMGAAERREVSERMKKYWERWHQGPRSKRSDEETGES